MQECGCFVQKDDSVVPVRRIGDDGPNFTNGMINRIRHVRPTSRQGITHEVSFSKEVATQANEATRTSPITNVESRELEVFPEAIGGAPGRDFHRMIVEKKGRQDTRVEVLEEASEMGRGDGRMP